MIASIILPIVITAAVAAVFFKFIPGEDNGHRRAKEALHSGSDSPAGDGAGADAAGPPAPGSFTYVPAGAIASSYGASPASATYARSLAMSQNMTPAQLARVQAYQAMNQQSAGNQYTVYTWGGGGAGGGGGQSVGPTYKPIESGGMKLGEFIGYRCWLIQPGGYLKSCASKAMWAPGETMEGDIGEDGRGLGVHAWKSKSLMLQYGGNVSGNKPIVIGSIRMWGELVEHERGYRSQYASILSIDDVIAPSHSLDAVAQALTFIREKYGVKP